MTTRLSDARQSEHGTVVGSGLTRAGSSKLTAVPREVISQGCTYQLHVGGLIEPKEFVGSGKWTVLCKHSCRVQYHVQCIGTVDLGGLGFTRASGLRRQLCLG